VFGALRIDRIAAKAGALAVEGEQVFSRCYRADDFLSRLVGLQATRDLMPDEALLIPRCASVHTLGMRAPLDVAFLDQWWTVVAVHAGLGTRRVARQPNAHAAVEAEAGVFPWKIGQVVSFWLH
jgi:uncharacterized membrane protein (UPF0127 family)